VVKYDLLSHSDCKHNIEEITLFLTVITCYLSNPNLEIGST